MADPRAASAAAGANMKRMTGIPSVGSFFSRGTQSEINVRKRELLSLPKPAQLDLLAAFSPCRQGQVSNQDPAACHCVGWKQYMSPSPGVLPADLASSDICRVCGHAKRDHYEHLVGIPDEIRQRLLKFSVDAETLHASYLKEDDPETKKIYLYLYRTLRKSMLELSEPQLDALAVLGKPPFEDPNLNGVVKAFLKYKMNQFQGPDWQHLVDAARGCLMAMTHWRVDPNRIQPLVDNADYVRWLCYCHVPTYCDSYPHHNISQVFGRKFFIGVLPYYKTQLIKYIQSRKETVGPDRQKVIDNFFPLFLDLFHQELVKEDSPVWKPCPDSQLTPTPPPHTPQAPQPLQAHHLLPQPVQQLQQPQLSITPPQTSPPLLGSASALNFGPSSSSSSSSAAQMHHVAMQLSMSSVPTPLTAEIEMPMSASVPPPSPLPAQLLTSSAPPSFVSSFSQVESASFPGVPEIMQAVSAISEASMPSETDIPMDTNEMRPLDGEGLVEAGIEESVMDDQRMREEEESSEDGDPEFIKPWIVDWPEEEWESLTQEAWEIVTEDPEPQAAFDENPIPKQAWAQIDEAEGKIKFRVLGIDETTQSLSESEKLWVLNVLDLVGEHLPHMPRQHVLRCMFDVRCRTVVVVKTDSDAAVGALCVRPFPEREMADISFLAVTAAEQGKGYGSYLVNHCRDLVTDLGCKYLFACPDIYAAGFFKMLGFTTELNELVSKKVYDGFAQEYEGGTLCGCSLDSEILYTEFHNVLKQQAMLLRLIWEKRNDPFDDFEVDGSQLFESPGTVLKLAQIPGLRKFGYNPDVERDLADRDAEVPPNSCPPDSDDEGKASASGVGGNGTSSSAGNGKSGGRSKDLNKPTKTQRGRKLAKGEAKSPPEPMVDGNGPRPITRRYSWNDDIDQDTLQSILKTVLNQVKNHPAAWPFLKPVDRLEVPDYYDVIKYAMDLKTMTERLKRGYYTHKNMFMIDMRRMLKNCRIYNGPETEYFKCADALQKFYVSKMQEFGIDAVI